MIKISEKPQQRKKGEKYEKILPEIKAVYALSVDEGMLIETPNPYSWKAYFYAYRQSLPEEEKGDFTFQKQTETSFKVWHIVKK